MDKVDVFKELDDVGIDSYSVTNKYLEVKEKYKDRAGNSTRWIASDMALWAAKKVATYYRDQIETMLDSVDRQVADIQIEYNKSLAEIRDAVKKVADAQPAHVDFVTDMINTVRDSTLVSKEYGPEGNKRKCFSVVRSEL